jgi:YesN/AraC family two-component response regulator
MKRILIVDDNMLMRRLIVNLLNRDEVCLDEASDGRAGLDMMEQVHYDLVITDLIMPGMEGIEMIRHTRRSYPLTKIIAISGGEPFYLYMAKRLGIQGIFTKPLEKYNFIKAVDSVIS